MTEHVPIRLVIADDHAIVLHGLKRLFENHADFEVIECCSDSAAALTAVRANACDVLILDLRMPGLTGLDVLKILSDERQQCRTVLLTAAISDDDVLQAVRLGAQGVVLKEAMPETLIECVRRVYRGEQWIDQETMSRAFRRVAQTETAARLTPREVDIVRMIAQGLRNRAIAERLSISEGTVKIHLHNVYEKLQVDGRLELMLYAREKGLE
jgi:DNA-binding NarL/FixJ family response regulator